MAISLGIYPIFRQTQVNSLGKNQTFSTNMAMAVEDHDVILCLWQGLE